MQRSSAIPTIGVELLDWSIAPKVRSYQPKPTAWVLSAKRTQGLKGPIHPRRLKEIVRAFSPPNPYHPSTQAVGLGWYEPHLRC
jgi:hypothetical protein